MEGEQIANARDALQILLRSIPENSKFNSLVLNLFLCTSTHFLVFLQLSDLELLFSLYTGKVKFILKLHLMKRPVILAAYLPTKVQLEENKGGQERKRRGLLDTIGN